MIGFGRVALGVAALLSLWAMGASAEGVTLTAEEAVRLAVEQSPAVAAARSRFEAASAGVRGARAPFNLQGELAPGVGFTNGNALLSQEIDIGGRRAAQTKAASGARAAAEAELNLARLQAAGGARTAYYDLVRARSIESAASESATLARQIRDAVRRRVEIGEAPVVQATRAEIEVARAEQDLVRARGEAQGRIAALNLLLGRAVDSSLTASEPLAAPEAPAASAELMELAQRQRPELAVARGLIAARQGEVAVARVQRRPELFAELASDVWSVDRDPLNSRKLGLQARLSFPLFDRGRLRAGVDRAQAGVREQEAELAVAARTIGIEIQRAAAELSAAREIALNYQTTILPRTQELLRATRAGFDSGLTSFLEVLEAQRLSRMTQTEYLNALFEAVRARIALDQALGLAPGLAPTTETPDRSPRK
jgi:cobalt-zinc-cadmium efflux system outer membrane protein